MFRRGASVRPAPPRPAAPLPASPPTPSPGHDKAASAATVPCEARREWGAKSAGARVHEVVGMDLVEVAPDYDPSGATQILAAQVLLNFPGVIFHASR
ncbi:MAG: arginase family protein [Proteobacteria bacterium]|nr:arginase family protein [Pseudomonadota bacterium]